MHDDRVQVELRIERILRERLRPVVVEPLVRVDRDGVLDRPP